MSPSTQEKPIRKVLVSAFGDVSNLSIISSTISSPASGEVQVAPIYSGFSTADINMRLGLYPLQKKAPLTPGYCLVGRVAATHASSGKSKFAIGTIVGCLTVYDAQATLVNLPEKYCFEIPQGIDLKIATPLVLDWPTAYQMVVRAAKVAKGQRVFIHGLSGAVGNALLKICVARGAIVYGTASPRNHAQLLSQGVKKAFTYANKDWIAAMMEVGKVHAVFDPLGFESWDESYSILSCTEPSILVGYGGNKATLDGTGEGMSALQTWLPTMKLLGRNMLIGAKKSTKFYYISRDDKHYLEDVKACFDMVAKGEVEVSLKKVWAMDDIKEAHRTYGKGEGMGSNLIKIQS